ncbi:unnamed protein product [Linum trigynum]|uniref:Uncharacterized protein n=1 Tax=Linum trigynum TaxID=586398 RepID=A0AAV2FID1_9ROSI
MQARLMQIDNAGEGGRSKAPQTSLMPTQMKAAEAKAAHARSMQRTTMQARLLQTTSAQEMEVEDGYDEERGVVGDQRNWLWIVKL